MRLLNGGSLPVPLLNVKLGGKIIAHYVSISLNSQGVIFRMAALTALHNHLVSHLLLSFTFFLSCVLANLDHTTNFVSTMNPTPTP